MHKIYFLDPTVRFDDKLVFANGMRTETKLCPLNTGLPSQHAMRQHWIRPLRLIGPVRRLTDFEWTVYRDILLEKDIVNKLQSSRFSGIEFQEAQLYTTTQTPIGREVFELKVNGWGGMAHPSSGVRLIEKCSFCGHSVFCGHANPGNLFDIDKWDGSDFFLIWPMPRYIFITNEVADFIRKEGYTGVNVRELHEFPKSIAGKYTPGHIEDWYEREKAVQILREMED